MSVTKLSLVGNNQIIPYQGEFDIPAGDGKTSNLLLQCSSILTMDLQTLGIYEYVDDNDDTNDNNKGGNDNDNEFNDDEVVDDLPEHGPGLKTV
jgi:hypothetical protein